MLGFTLARLQYLSVRGRYSKGTAPGEWYWTQSGHYRVGITMHLACILPLGLLCIWQFVPIIRHKAILFHRINGYTVLLLLFTSTAGALMIARRSFGGLVPTVGGVYTLSFIVITEVCLAYYNIKRLQIDQHRKWMLRAFVTMGCIITVRLIMFPAARIITILGDYYLPMACEEIQFVWNQNNVPIPLTAVYPGCNITQPLSGGQVAVLASYNSAKSLPEQAAVGLQLGFSLAVSYTWSLPIAIC
jgi:uncharacterized membrane protein